ncbi:MAG: ribonuclease [Methylothermaceae bacteria B42]|nr:MAG: ribonuclease [Methylothermaceae bacteria B42]HHJ38951.1 type II toxin-antitoxin system VapC family toxin [Methylothermaceae bacterium]
MILIDTSVWIDHFRYSLPPLEALLNRAQVLIHPWVIGELACGHLKNRKIILRLLEALPQATLPSHEEAMFFLEQNNLMGRGIGYIDLHLLAATTLTNHARLWTLDRRLALVAGDLRLGFSPSNYS